MRPLASFAIGFAIGLVGIMVVFGRRRWRVQVANGHISSARYSWFMARAIARKWPGGVARVVRDGR